MLTAGATTCVIKYVLITFTVIYNMLTAMRQFLTAAVSVTVFTCLNEIKANNVLNLEKPTYQYPIANTKGRSLTGSYTTNQ